MCVAYVQVSQTNIDGIKHIHLRDFFENDNPGLMPLDYEFFLFCQIHRNGYPLLALRESIRHHSVPKLTASLVLYAPPIHLHGYHEEYVVCILMVGYHFLPIWLWLFLVLYRIATLSAKL